MIISKVWLVYGLVTIVTAGVVFMSNLEIKSIEKLSLKKVWKKFSKKPQLGKALVVLKYVSVPIKLGISGITLGVTSQFIPFVDNATFVVSGGTLNGVGILLAVVTGFVGERLLLAVTDKFILKQTKDYHIEKATLNANTPVEEIIKNTEEKEQKD